MATIRVYLLTYRRPQLLHRALASLRAQTFTDWVCELHNDAPDDDGPRALLQEIGDDRCQLHQHEENWGPVKSFNHAFSGGPEPFLALLEDDNWWESNFLETALEALKEHPDASVAWSNMTLWQEQPHNQWADTGKTVWVVPKHGTRVHRFRWPIPRQCFDALHSNGAMVCRVEASRAATVPTNTPFDIIEPVRERLLAGVWLLLPQALANFAITQRTARSTDRSKWISSQLLVAASYLLAVRPSGEGATALWSTLRQQSPPATNLLLLVGLPHANLRYLWRGAHPSDWLRFLLGAVRHPLTLRNTLRHYAEQTLLRDVMIQGAQNRCLENPSNEDAPRLYQKSLLSPGA